LWYILYNYCIWVCGRICVSTVHACVVDFCIKTVYVWLSLFKYCIWLCVRSCISTVYDCVVAPVV
jgi:hypothetical protein